MHVEEEESPENLQWDIKKTFMDVIHFRNRWQVRGCTALQPSKLVLYFVFFVFFFCSGLNQLAKHHSAGV